MLKLTKKKLSGFTLVELIVVITIVVILGTIAFISLGGYSLSARDSTRISNLNNLHKGLSVFQIKAGTYPMPEGPITLTASGPIIGYQGFAKELTESIAKLSPGATKDPLDPTIYTTYSVNQNQTKIQLMNFLEDGSTATAHINNIQNFIPTTFANATTDYSKRTPSTKGDTLGILLGNTGTTLNQPVQESYNVSSFTGVDVVNTNTGYNAVISKNLSISGTGASLKRVDMLFSAPASKMDSNTISDIANGSLVGYWDMETTTSDGKLKDMSGNGNGGVVNGTTVVSGKTGNARSFNGINNIVNVANHPSMTLDKNITTSAWIRYAAFVNSDNELVGKYANSSGSNAWIVFRSTGTYENGCILNRICLLVTPPGSGFLNGQNMLVGSSTTVALGTWYHVASVYDYNANQLKMYINGVLENTVTRTGAPGIATNGLNTSIGGNSGDNNRYSSALIDEVRIYNRVLSDIEVLALYNAAK